MKNIESIIDEIEQYMNEKEDLREKSIKVCRNVIQSCRKAVQKMHRNANVDAAKDLEKALAELTELQSSLKEEHHDILYSGFMEDAYKELSEAFCLLSILQEEDLPRPEDIGVTYSSYLLGLGDVVGELRRCILDNIRKDQYENANKLLQTMENIYNSLIRFDYPSALIPIRRVQDNCRALIEKTRGDLTIALCKKKIEDKINDIKKTVEEEKYKKKKTEESEDLDLNIDKVW
jgi:translin